VNCKNRQKFSSIRNRTGVSPTATNKRVAVIDTDTGVFKRCWGAYGNKPDDAPQPHDRKGRLRSNSAVRALLRLVSRQPRVCLRPANNRLQVFTRRQVREKSSSRRRPAATARSGMWRSRRIRSEAIYIADGKDERVYVLRESLELLTSGDGGRQPGQFFAVHSIAAD
jgi:hypothetical protein